MAGMRRRMQFVFKEMEDISKEKEIRIYYIFVLNIEISISFFYYYLLLDGLSMHI